MASWWTISVPAERLSIDLNADLGEADDAPGTAIEHGLFDLITSAHIACGGHAGDDESMRATVQAALDAGVRVGAHPSYPDRAGFGRRPMAMGASDLASSLADQIGALINVAASLGAEVCSVKPHGALYGEVGSTAATFDALVGVLVELCEPGTSLVLPSGSPAVTRWLSSVSRPALGISPACLPRCAMCRVAPAPAPPCRPGRSLWPTATPPSIPRRRQADGRSSVTRTSHSSRRGSPPTPGWPPATACSS
jgi:hypothetical protein